MVTAVSTRGCVNHCAQKGTQTAQAAHAYIHSGGLEYHLLLPLLLTCSELTRWLAARAEEAGVDIFPGFAGACFFSSLAVDKFVQAQSSPMGRV
jgi:hypothetical protein